MQGLVWNQITQIQERLSPEIRHNEGLQEEVLDHLCCLVEASIRSGIPFEEAVNQAFGAFGEQGLGKLEHQVHQVTQSKYLLMKQLSVLTLLFTIGLTVLLNQQTYGQEVPEIFPLSNSTRVVSGFGIRTHPITKEKRHHFGVDFMVEMGTEVLATARGKVIKIQTTDTNKGYGIHLIIEHQEGYKTLYAHLSEVKVKEGQYIQQGEVIGLSGNSGISKRPHLHYEIMHHGEKVDPEPFLKQG